MMLKKGRFRFVSVFPLPDLSFDAPLTFHQPANAEAGPYDVHAKGSSAC